MKNIINTIKKMNKKVLGIIGGAILAIIILIVVICSLSGTKTITCKIDKDQIKGFHLNEEVVFKIKKDQIQNIKLTKELVISGDYANFDTYQSVIKNHFESAYNYINDKNKKLESGKNSEKVTIDLDESGIVLNNLTISLNDKSNKYDIQVNTINNLDAEKNVYKVNQIITKDKLIKEVEKAGYKCQ